MMSQYEEMSLAPLKCELKKRYARVRLENGNGRLIIHAVVRQMAGHTGPACYFRLLHKLKYIL